MTSISADQQRATDSNSKMGTAMQGLVSADGQSQISRIGATKNWSHGIADAYQTGAHNGAFFHIAANPYGGGNPVAGLYQNVVAGNAIDPNIADSFDPNDPANQTGGGGGGSTNPVGDFQNAANSADDTLDQANSAAEDQRVSDVTGVRDTLVAGLATADTTWGSTMSSAGAALGSALDGIQDFDWQHVRDFVGEVTGARRAAEIGALTAQVGFVTSYYGAVNTYTASIATAGVAHETGYAQATADYYVHTREV